MWSDGGYLRVVEGRPGGNGIVTSRDFASGETIIEVAAGAELDHATRFTLQLDAGRHIDVDEIRYLNHSCAPNAFFHAATRRLVAEREIRTGDELAIFYPASEWDMACPFLCACGADACVQFVAGACYLSPAVRARYRLNEHILRLFSARGDGVSAEGGR